MSSPKINGPVLTNVLIWIAAFAVPSLIELIPVSHPPKIFPLLFFVFRAALAGLSTYMLYTALKQIKDKQPSSR
ncbi:MAG: hypothetical protein WBD31_27200 [Rubripirellula sp.]